MRTEHTRAIERRSKQKRAKILKAVGLNSRGREYKRTPNLPPEERAEHYRKANLEKWHVLCRRRLMLGQTSRGTKRVYLITLPVDDIAALDAEINLLGEQLAGLYDHLPAAAQARVVQLGHSISNLKMRIQVARPQEHFRQ